MEEEKELCVPIIKISGGDLPTDVSKGEEYNKLIQYRCNIKPIKPLLCPVYSHIQVIISHEGLRMGTILKKGCCPPESSLKLGFSKGSQPLSPFP